MNIVLYHTRISLSLVYLIILKFVAITTWGGDACWLVGHTDKLQGHFHRTLYILLFAESFYLRCICFPSKEFPSVFYTLQTHHHPYQSFSLLAGLSMVCPTIFSGLLLIFFLGAYPVVPKLSRLPVLLKY